MGETQGSHNHPRIRQGRPSAAHVARLLTTQGHLLDIGKALDECDRRPPGQRTSRELRLLLERALLPVEPLRAPTGMVRPSNIGELGEPG